MKRFGTDGLRGKYGETVTEEDAFRLGRFLGRNGGRVVSGRDTRESGQSLQDALAAGVGAGGGSLLSLGIAGTPEVCFAAAKGAFDWGVIITASHNPWTDNGLKLLASSGREPDSAALTAAEKAVNEPAPEEESSLVRPAPEEEPSMVLPMPEEKPSMVLPGSEDNPPTQTAAGIREAYLSYLTRAASLLPGSLPGESSLFPGYLSAPAALSPAALPEQNCPDDPAGEKTGASLSLSGLRIALDCANGALSFLAPELFRKLGAETFPLAANPDGRNINRECGSVHPEKLESLVREKRLDAGFAFDGDGDRCLMVLPEGRLLDGDGILYFLSSCAGLPKELPVVGTVMSNLGLERALSLQGRSLVRSDVGIHEVEREMRRSGARIGGEPSGHLLFAGSLSGGDGLLTALVLSRLLKENCYPEEYRIFPQTLRNVPVRDKNLVLKQPEVQETLQRLSREYAGRGRLLLRPSGTEEVFRVMAEAETEDLSREMAERMAEVCAAAGKN